VALKAVLFDAGGTLIHPDYARVGEVLRRVVGRAPAARDYVEAEYSGRAAIEAAMTSDPASTDGRRWVVHFGAMFGRLGYSADEIRAAAPHVEAEHARANLWTVPQPGAAEGLASLRGAGYTVGCVSNADGTVEGLLSGAGFAGCLEFVVDSGAVGIEKPDPRIFHLALERAGARADEALYVGDLYPVDVVGARGAGIEPVLLDPLGRYGDRDCRTARDVPTLCRELVALAAAP